MFITFEGVEGSGKTTQIKLLAQYLKQHNYDFIVTKEPGGTIIGSEIRKILLNPNHKDLHRDTELLLYVADRIQHIRQVIVPALEDGKIIICDRYIDSTITYQHTARGIDIKIIKKLHDLFLYELKPKMTFLLDIDPEISLKRSFNDLDSGKRDTSESRFEQETLDFHRHVRSGYLSLALDSQNEKRITIINADKPVEEVFNDIINKLSEILPNESI